ncbi:hypothetical protein [Candidatus Phytoplasma oryzae]|nr:hypothetical protein PIE28_02140 [Candidatus Phytoplasma oryzae]
MYFLKKNFCNNSKDNEFIILSNINIKVYVRYLKLKNNEIKKEWFLKNLFFVYEGKKYSFLEVIVFFEHIDDDNPEFFLQSEQIIRIVKGKITIQKNQNVLFIDRFQQLSEEERLKSINSS